MSSASALLGAVQQAAKADPSWAIGVIGAALRPDAPAKAVHLIESIGWGLREAKWTPEDGLHLLRLCAEGAWPLSAAYALSSTVERWSRGLSETDTTSDLLDAFDRAADAFYARSTDLPSGVSSTPPGSLDWVTRAINHPAGHAAQIWLHVAEARDHVDGQFVLSLDDAERARWARVASDASASGDFARPILGLALERLTAGDYPWAVKNIYPAFDASADLQRAQQMWEGRLSHSRWSWPVVEALRPYWPAYLAKADSLNGGRHSEHLGEVMALFVAEHQKSGFTLELVQTFIMHASKESRVAFARSMPKHLERLTPDERRDAWQSILRPYWHGRRTHVPRPLDGEEVREMISWVVALPEVAPDVIAEMKATASPAIEHGDHILWQWREDDAWVRGHPSEAVAILHYLAEHRAIQLWNEDEAVTLLETALAAGAPHAAVAAAASALATALPAAQRPLQFMQSLREADA